MIPGRLSFRLPDFCRVAWASDAHHATWSRRIWHTGRAWAEMERWSVVEGVRPGTLQTVDPEELPAVAAWAAKHGVVALPIAAVGATASYSATSAPVQPGGSWSYRVAICRPELAGEWGGADDRRIGELLGYPECCRDFFDRVWTQAGIVDTTWPMYETTSSAQGPPEANILLRWLGVRLVPHLPCSFACGPTVELGRSMAEVGIRLGYAAEVDWMREMLEWPVEWSALHGIAEIRYPVARVSALTEATADKLVVRREGIPPADMARGVVFPYSASPLVQLRARRRRKASAPPNPREWGHNGFSSREAMEQAHGVVLEASVLLSAGDHLTDLGCGNGRLLEEFGQRTPGLTLSGIERDAERAASARRRLPGADIREDELCGCGSWPNASHVLLMPGRLLEAGGKDLTRLRSWLAGRVLVVYAYGDWLERYGGLAGLCAEAGIALASTLREESSVAVGEGVMAEMAVTL